MAAGSTRRKSPWKSKQSIPCQTCAVTCPLPSGGGRCPLTRGQARAAPRARGDTAPAAPGSPCASITKDEYQEKTAPQTGPEIPRRQLQLRRVVPRNPTIPGGPQKFSNGRTESSSHRGRTRRAMGLLLRRAVRSAFRLYLQAGWNSCPPRQSGKSCGRRPTQMARLRKEPVCLQRRYQSRLVSVATGLSLGPMQALRGGKPPKRSGAALGLFELAHAARGRDNGRGAGGGRGDGRRSR